MAISDIHNNQAVLSLPSADLLIVAGDLTDTGSYKELEDFSSFLSAQKPKFERIIVVAGNHELTFDEQFYLKHGERYYHKPALDPRKAKDILLSNADITYLEDSGCEFRGVKIWGTPWIPPIGRWAFSLPSPAFAEQTFAKIPPDTDILVSHAPPFGVLDEVTYYGYECDQQTGERVQVKEVESSGSRELARRVFDVKPRLHIFGHVHEGSGARLAGETLFVNAAIMNKEHKPGNKPKLIEVDFA